MAPALMRSSPIEQMQLNTIFTPTIQKEKDFLLKEECFNSSFFSCSTSPQNTRKTPCQKSIVSITGFSKSQKGHIKYHLNVSYDHDDLLSTFAIRRRFTDFKNLHQSLCQKFPTTVLPSLPETGFFSYWNRYKLSLMNSRKIIFQQILDAILQNSLLVKSPEFRIFLGKPPHSISSYVSFDDYSVPKVNKKLEIIQRRRVASQIRASTKRQISLPSSVAA